MSKPLQVGNDTFNYPSPGDKAGWGEEATGWAEAVTDTLANISGPNDILITSATLSNNQVTPANIPGLLLNTGEVQSFELDVLIYRTYNSGSSVAMERAKILGYFNGSDVYISQESVGTSGVDLSVTSGGQFQYTSSNLTNHVSSVIRFRMRTEDSL